MSEASSKKGRPSRLTPELIERIAQHVRDGLNEIDAGTLERVPKSTMHDWLKRDAELSDAVARARVERKMELVQQVKAGIMASGKPGDWKAAIRLLESWESDEYAVTQQVEHRVQSELGDLLAVAREVLPEEQLAALLHAYEARYGAEGAASQAAKEPGPTVH